MFDSITDTEAPELSCNLTTDNFEGVLFEFPKEPMRIVIAGSSPQWVLQRRSRNSRSKWPWTSLAQCTTRDGLTRVLRGRYKAIPGLREFVDSLPEHVTDKTT